MRDIHLPLTADGGPDDLPRTLRRERERQARERDSSPGGAGFPPAEATTYQPVRAAVTRFDVPFLRLMFFFFKAVFAMVPALLLLGAILWSLGHLLQKIFPQLVKMQILIWFPN